MTRRGVLATISSIFDPLGIASPFVLKGRQILQQITSDEKDWDAPIPEELAKGWIKWKQSLHQLEEMSVPRCYKTTKCKIVNATLHSFLDAVEIGYGQVTYLRLEDENGHVDVAFVMGKACHSTERNHNAQVGVSGSCFCS